LPTPAPILAVYTQNPLGQGTEAAMPGVTYTDNPVGRLRAVWAPHEETVSFGYDSGGRLTEWFDPLTTGSGSPTESQ